MIDNSVARLEEMSNDILNRATQLTGEDILRHYREDFIVKQSVENPLISEAKRKHILELRSTLAEWLSEHLAGQSFIGDLDKLKRESLKLAFDYDMLTEAISQLLSDDIHLYQS